MQRAAQGAGVFRRDGAAGTHDRRPATAVIVYAAGDAGCGGVNMDVAEFFSELRRMCKSSSDCTKCQYHGGKWDNAIELLEKTVAEVEQWSREHPRKTRQDVFLEQWPETNIEYGVLKLRPCVISESHRDAQGNCATIQRK